MEPSIRELFSITWPIRQIYLFDMVMVPIQLPLEDGVQNFGPPQCPGPFLGPRVFNFSSKLIDDKLGIHHLEVGVSRLVDRTM
jgi:hypothetical protein